MLYFISINLIIINNNLIDAYFVTICKMSYPYQASCDAYQKITE